MALLPDEPVLSARRLLLVGVPSFLAAVAISLVTHQHAHEIGSQVFCGDAAPLTAQASFIGEPGPGAGDCGYSALAGQAWTVGLALLSFALFLRFPNNLFLLSMAFVNVTARLPETVTVFLQYLINSQTSLRVDESLSLGLIGLSDPTIPTVVMCFYTLLLLFFAIIVVHDVRSIRYKWPIAFGLFAVMGFIEQGVVWALGMGPLA